MLALCSCAMPKMRGHWCRHIITVLVKKLQLTHVDMDTWAPHEGTQMLELEGQRAIANGDPNHFQTLGLASATTGNQKCLRRGGEDEAKQAFNQAKIAFNFAVQSAQSAPVTTQSSLQLIRCRCPLTP